MITKEQIKNGKCMASTHGNEVYCQSRLIPLLRKLWFNSDSQAIAVNQINDSNIFEITQPNGEISKNLFFVRSGRKKIVYDLISI